MVYGIEYVQNGKITIKKLLLLTILLLAPAFTVVACAGTPTEAPADGLEEPPDSVRITDADGPAAVTNGRRQGDRGGLHQPK